MTPETNMQAMAIAAAGRMLPTIVIVVVVNANTLNMIGKGDPRDVG